LHHTRHNQRKQADNKAQHKAPVATTIAAYCNRIHSFFRLTLVFTVSNVPFEDTMKKTTFLLIGAALLFSIALPLHAQYGCVSSPENPTAILAVVGSAGAFFVSARARIKARRNSSK
jgi:XrtJ-associated TM-motif-TM protein